MVRDIVQNLLSAEAQSFERSVSTSSERLGTGIPLPILQRFVATACGSHVPSGVVDSFFERFTSSSSASSEGDADSGRRMLPFTDLDEFCKGLEPLTEYSVEDMYHTYVTVVLKSAFDMLTKVPLSGSSGSQSPALALPTLTVQTTHADPAIAINAVGGNTTIRKELVREYLDVTMAVDEKPLMDGHDFAHLTRSCRRSGDLEFEDFTDIMQEVLKTRRVSSAVLSTNLEDTRQQRREIKRVALAKIKAAVSSHTSSLNTDSLRVASPPRRRALSPYAFSSWRANQGAVLQQPASVGGSGSPAASATTPDPGSRDSNSPVPPSALQKKDNAASSLGSSVSNEKGDQVIRIPDYTPPVRITAAATQQQKGLSTNTNDTNAMATVTSSSSYDFTAHSTMVDEAFALLDVGEGGSVSLDAIYEFCAAFPHPPPQNAIRRIFHVVDVNASNDIDREEFEQLCFLLQQKTALTVTDMCTFYSKAMYRRLFELLDDEGDSNDSVSREELRILLEAISPILQASFSSSDVFRLTREMESDQLNFDQFQTVVKQLIKGRSISKVVSAFEEVLRRRRMVKRQALERFVQATKPTPAPRRIPPPPVSPPEPKLPLVCQACVTHGDRIRQLEEEKAAMEQLLEKAERQRDDAVRERDSLRRDVHYRWPSFTRWFSEMDRCVAKVSSSPVPPNNSDEAQQDSAPVILYRSLCHANAGSSSSDDERKSASTLTYEMLSSASRAAVYPRVASLAQLIGDAAACPLSGDGRGGWIEETFSQFMAEASERLRDTHALMTLTVLPRVFQILTAAKELFVALNHIVEAQRGLPLSTENESELLKLLSSVSSSREALRTSWLECDGSRVGSRLLKARDEASDRALLQMSLSQMLSNKEKNIGGEKESKSRSTMSLQNFECASLDIARFIDFFHAFVSCESDVEIATKRLLDMKMVADSRDTSAMMDRVEASLNSSSSLLADHRWNQVYVGASRSATEVAEIVAQPLGGMTVVKRDKAVMVNLIDINGTLPPLSARSGTSDLPTARDRSPSISVGQPRGTMTGGPGPASSFSPIVKEMANRSSSPRVRNRRERPLDSRQHLDILLADFRKTWGPGTMPCNFERVDPQTNVFYFGTKKIELSAVDTFITVKVGGGYLLFEEFCQKNAATEIRRLGVITDRTRSSSPLTGASTAVGSPRQDTFTTPRVGAPKASAGIPAAVTAAGTSAAGGGGGGLPRGFTVSMPPRPAASQARGASPKAQPSGSQAMTPRVAQRSPLRRSPSPSTPRR